MTATIVSSAGRQTGSTTRRPTVSVTPRATAPVLVTALAPAAWGTTYLVTTELLPPDRPLLAGVLRALPAGLALAAWTRQRPFGAWWGRALVLGTAIAYSLWFRGIDRLPVGQVSLLGLLSPVVATAAGWLVVDQRLTLTQIGGAGLVLAAMWLGQRRPGSPPGAQRGRAMSLPIRLTASSGGSAGLHR